MTIERDARVRPRYGRVSAVAVAAVVVLVSLLGGVGLLPVHQPAAADTAPDAEGRSMHDRVALARLISTGRPDRAPESAARRTPARRAHAGAAQAMLPRHSGTGRRVVFDISAQRVWLVRASGRVLGTYLVSGSRTDNLRPGSYAVWSRSRTAYGIDDSGTMEFFVRFAHGERAAIGFHSIPRKDGKPLQSRAQLGTPQSHGCIRQARPDARRMWEFAPVGTKVVVTA